MMLLVAPMFMLHAAAVTASSPPAAALLQDTPRLLEWLRAQSPEAAAADARVGQARADVGQATVWFPNPSVNMGVGGWPLGPTNPAGLGLHETVNFSAGVSQPLEVAKRGPRMRSAELGLQSERENRVALLTQRLSDARLALADAAFKQMKVSLLSEVLETTREAEALEKVRMEHGDLSGNEFDRLTLERNALELDLQAGQAELRGSQGMCQAVVYLPCVVEDARPEMLSVPLPEGVDVDAWVDRLPLARSAKLAEGAAHEAASLANRAWLPDPTLALGFTHDAFQSAGNNPNVAMMGVSIPVPVFDHGQNAAAKARARASELHATASAVVLQARAQAHALLEQERLLLDARTQLEGSALPRALDVLQNSEKAFRAGQVSLTDFLLARRAVTSLRLRLLEVRFQGYAVRNELRRVLGMDAQMVRETLG
jgi:cobalt-zinc-cadmium efflux system outer membrane protein